MDKSTKRVTGTMTILYQLTENKESLVKEFIDNIILALSTQSYPNEVVTRDKGDFIHRVQVERLEKSSSEAPKECYPCSHLMQENCTECGKEQHAMAVWDISHGWHPCIWCGKYNKVVEKTK